MPIKKGKIKDLKDQNKDFLKATSLFWSSHYFIYMINQNYKLQYISVPRFRKTLLKMTKGSS